MRGLFLTLGVYLVRLGLERERNVSRVLFPSRIFLNDGWELPAFRKLWSVSLHFAKCV